MIENNLIKALREFIKEAVKDFRLPVENPEPIEDGDIRAPQIINGYLPPKRSEAKDDFPFVMVRPEKGSIGEVRKMTISIVVGCYTEEYDGYELCLSVMTRIANALNTMPNNILASKYVLSSDSDIDWELPDNQPYPQWELYMTTHWEFNSPQAIFEEV